MLRKGREGRSGTPSDMGRLPNNLLEHKLRGRRQRVGRRPGRIF